MPCAHIPLTDLRQTTLKEFVSQTLSGGQNVPLEQIYVLVAARFGEQVCEPQTSCPHYDQLHPEFHHLVRRVLQDGKDDGEFENGPRGYWRQV